MTFGMALAEHLTMAASAGMFYVAIDYENEPNTKVAIRNVNIKMDQLFSKERILGVRVTIAQRKTSGGLTRTGFGRTCRPYLYIHSGVGINKNYIFHNFKFQVCLRSSGE